MSLLHRRWFAALPIAILLTFAVWMAASSEGLPSLPRVSAPARVASVALVENDLMAMTQVDDAHQRAVEEEAARQKAEAEAAEAARVAAEEEEARRQAAATRSMTTSPPLSGTGAPHSDAWWWGVAICEQGGRNDPYFGYFSFMDGSQGGRPWADQVAAGNALLLRAGREIGPWAASCVAAGYRASPSG